MNDYDEPDEPVRLLQAHAAGRPLVTWLLLAVIALATTWEFVRFGLDPEAAELTRAGGVSAGAVVTGEWWKLVTANVLHANLGHLLMNGIVIALTGRWIEPAVGRLTYLTVIVWSGLIASAASLVVDHAFVTTGASGIAFGIFGAGFIADPRARTPVGQMVRQLLVLNIVLSFLPGVALGGHLGGLVGGLVAGAVCWRVRHRTIETNSVDAADGEPDAPHQLLTTLGAPRRRAAVAMLIVGCVCVATLVLGPARSGIGTTLGAAEAFVAQRQLSALEFTSVGRIRSIDCDPVTSRRELTCSINARQYRVAYEPGSDEPTLR